MHPRLNGVAGAERHRMQTRPSIIAVDMDGTFLTDSKTFDTERFSRILPRLQALGIHFVVASGNTYAKLQDYMRGFENQGLIYIAENGAYLADESGQLAVHPFEEEDVPRIIEVVQEFLEETTFHRDRISSDGYRSRVLYHRNMRNR